jgi:iron-sulfur cluster assembly protein
MKKKTVKEKRTTSKAARVTKKTVKKHEQRAQRITKDMLIGDAIARYPSAIMPLIEAGIHCVGCHAANAETLAEGLASHGKTRKEIDTIITALNKSIPEEIILRSSKGSLAITEPAAKKLAAFLAERTKEKKGLRHSLRITAAEGGCGCQYTFDLETKKREGDTVFTTQGATIFVDKASMKFLAGAKIDYVETPGGGGFRISNPRKPCSQQCC